MSVKKHLKKVLKQSIQNCIFRLRNTNIHIIMDLSNMLFLDTIAPRSLDWYFYYTPP